MTLTAQGPLPAALAAGVIEIHVQFGALSHDADLLVVRPAQGTDGGFGRHGPDPFVAK